MASRRIVVRVVVVVVVIIIIITYLDPDYNMSYHAILFKEFHMLSSVHLYSVCAVKPI